MIRHYFRMIWNRKGANALLVIEMVACFLVLFMVTAMLGNFLPFYAAPVGFDDARLLDLQLDDRDRGAPGTENLTSAPVVLQALAMMPDVESVAGMDPTPVSMSESNRRFRSNGKPITHRVADVTEKANETLGLTVVRGRWFAAEDAGSPWEPIVITQSLATEAFGPTEDPLGKDIVRDSEPGRAPSATPDRPRKIIGVVADYRQAGNLDTETEHMFQLAGHPAREGWQWSYLRGILVKLKSSASADAEARIASQLRLIAPDRTFRISRVAENRRFVNAVYTLPIMLGVVVCGFLIVMTVLGLSGVLFQAVATRTREMGVRRALGASAEDVARQIRGELLALTACGLVLGGILVAQVPVFDFAVLEVEISAAFVAGSAAVAGTLLLGLAFACAYYPSRLATRVHPSEALRYE